ncbi:MAG: nodulation protein NfeD [Chloroflexota bacterium]|nr:nodulation protein NfeD [Chloroflexota bacterium]
MPQGPSRRQLSRMIAGAALCGGLLCIAANAQAAGGNVVRVLPTTGIVDNVMAGYLADGIARAGRDGAVAVVIELDTPGGSLEATKQIVSTLLEAPLPVIVWVAPAGGHAASAGTFITLAANAAYMAPGTRIGAATPVGGQGEDIPGALGQKVLNDSVAFIRSIAETRGRPVDWAISTVKDAKSSSANEAVAVGAVDGIAGSLDELRSAVGVRTVSVRGRDVPLSLGGATFAEQAMNPLQAFIHLLSDPNIAFILFTIGFYGLFFELQNPNFVTGIVGGLAIVLAFIGFGSLPLNVAGLILLGLGLVLFALEATVTSHGLLGIGGLICFVLGASALYTEPGPFEPNVGIAVPLLVVATTTTALFMGLIAIGAMKTRAMRGSTGTVGVSLTPGFPGEVRSPLQPIGSIYAAGEEWSARAVDDRPLERGTPVRVVRIDGLTLVVEPDPSQSSS